MTRRTKQPPPKKVYKIGYHIGNSNKVYEIEIRGSNVFTDESSEELPGTWGIWDECEQVVFAIPLHALVFCVVEAARPRKSSRIRKSAVVTLTQPKKLASV